MRPIALTILAVLAACACQGARPDAANAAPEPAAAPSPDRPAAAPSPDRPTTGSALLVAKPLCTYSESLNFLAVHFIADAEYMMPKSFDSTEAVKTRIRDMWTIECRGQDCEAVKVNLTNADAGKPVTFMDVSSVGPSVVQMTMAGNGVALIQLADHRSVSVDFRGGEIVYKYSDPPDTTQIPNNVTYRTACDTTP
jgi:hypothetical protein